MRFASGVQRIAGNPVRAGAGVERWVLLAAAGALSAILVLLFTPCTDYARGVAVVRPDDRLVAAGLFRPRLLVVLPGHALPYLAPGRPVRFSVDGFRWSYQTASLGAVVHQVLGGSEVRRLVGPAQADLVAGEGPFALADAPLEPDFPTPGGRYPFHAGMRATAWVGLRDASLFATIFCRP
jgi:hypothetical protein